MYVYICFFEKQNQLTFHKINKSINVYFKMAKSTVKLYFIQLTKIYNFNGKQVSNTAIYLEQNSSWSKYNF